MKLKLKDKEKKVIFLFFLAIIILTVVNILFFTFCTTLVKHSEKNTYEVSGIVTEFEYVPPAYFGRKIRRPHIIHLDNGTDCVFYYLNYEMYYDDPKQEKIRHDLEGKYVVIRLSKIDDSVITIDTDEKCYLSFEASNCQCTIGIIAFALFDFSVIFVLFVVYVDPIISRIRYKQLGKKQKRRKNNKVLNNKKLR